MILKFYKYLATAIMVSIAIPSNTAFSLPLEDNLNLKASMGLATGTVTQKDVGSVGLFAFPLNIGIWGHLATNHSLGLEGNLTFDLGNLQVAKYGLEAAYFYHLMGGSPNTVEGGGVVGIKKSNYNSLTLVIKTGYFIYSITNPSSSKQSISGSTIPFKPGIAYRFGNYEFEFLYNVLNMSVGGNDIQDSSLEFTFGYRITI